MKAELIQKEATKLTAGIEDWELEEDLQDAFIEGALWAEKTIIAKACDLLRDLDVFTEDFINDFRKAMKGE